jgi:hypothetical protein
MPPLGDGHNNRKSKPKAVALTVAARVVRRSQRRCDSSAPTAARRGSRRSATSARSPRRSWRGERQRQRQRPDRLWPRPSSLQRASGRVRLGSVEDRRAGRSTIQPQSSQKQSMVSQFALRSADLRVLVAAVEELAVQLEVVGLVEDHLRRVAGEHDTLPRTRRLAAAENEGACPVLVGFSAGRWSAVGSSHIRP